MAAPRIIPLVLAGGAGTRLWPVSRDAMPKQFLPLVGEKSTYQQALMRVSSPDLFVPPIVMTAASEVLRFPCGDFVSSRGYPPEFPCSTTLGKSACNILISRLDRWAIAEPDRQNVGCFPVDSQRIREMRADQAP
jgi:hypothetical protein